MSSAYLSLGSNIEPELHLKAAANALREKFPGIEFSPVYETQAIGFDGPVFMNAAAKLTTSLDPIGLNNWLHELENAQGRTRTGPRFSSRTLDIDIVFYDDLTMSGPKELTIPRPEIKYAFVLKPLSDIAPDFVDPMTGETIMALWQHHEDYEKPLKQAGFSL